MISSPFLSTVLEFQKAFAEKKVAYHPMWVNLPFSQILGRLAGRQLQLRETLTPSNESRAVVMYSGGLWSTILLARHLVLGHQVKVVHINTPGRKQDILGAWRLATGEHAVLEQESDQLLSNDLRTIKRNSSELEYFEVDIPDAFTIKALEPAVIYATGALFGLRVSAGFTHRDVPGWLVNALMHSAKTFYGQETRFYSLVQNATPSSMLLDYVECGGRQETLKGLMSCVSPIKDEHCGCCWPCYKRYRAFQDVNWVFDFHTPPWDGPAAKAHEKRWVSGPGKGAV